MFLQFMLCLERKIKTSNFNVYYITTVSPDTFSFSFNLHNIHNRRADTAKLSFRCTFHAIQTRRQFETALSLIAHTFSLQI